MTLTPEQIEAGMTRDEAMERILDMIGDAYASGAVDVHSAWVADLGQLEPDFGEATSDYKASVAEAAATVIQQAFAERDGEIERLREALRDMADAVAVYSQQPVEATRQAGVQQGLDMAAGVAEAIDSGRGNEKVITAAIRKLGGGDG